jgi:hypothetical protein
MISMDGYRTSCALRFAAHCEREARKAAEAAEARAKIDAETQAHLARLVLNGVVDAAG